MYETRARMFFFSSAYWTYVRVCNWELKKCWPYACIVTSTIARFFLLKFSSAWKLKNKVSKHLFKEWFDPNYCHVVERFVSAQFTYFIFSSSTVDSGQIFDAFAHLLTVLPKISSISCVTCAHIQPGSHADRHFIHEACCSMNGSSRYIAYTLSPPPPDPFHSCCIKTHANTLTPNPPTGPHTPPCVQNELVT